MIDEIRELLFEIDNHKVNPSIILSKLLTLYKMNDLDIPDLFINESSGYDKVATKDIPPHRKVPYSIITYSFSTGTTKGSKIPLENLFDDPTKEMEKILSKTYFPITSPLTDLDNWVAAGGITLKVDREINAMKRVFIEGGGVVIQDLAVYSFSLDLSKEFLRSMTSKIRFQLKEEILNLAKKHKVSTKISLEFNKDIINLIKDQRVIVSLTEAWKCYSAECYTAGSIMLRKSLETSIHIGFRSKFGNDDLLKDNNGKYHGLKKKMDIVVGNGLAGSSIVDTLKSTTKLLSDLAAHSFTVKLRVDDFINANNVLRTFMEDFFTRITPGHP